MQEEIFGPILVSIAVENVDQAISLVNSKPHPLALYLFTNEQKTIDKVVSTTISGGVCVNDLIHHNILLECPFGGIGDSGCGGYNGKHSFETFTHRKTVLHKSGSLPDPPVRFPPYTDFKRGVWKWLLFVESGAFMERMRMYFKLLGVVALIAIIAYLFRGAM